METNGLQITFSWLCDLEPVVQYFWPFSVLP